MSFFQIVDVITNSKSNRLGGPKNLGGSQYQSNTYRFPEDIGSYDKGHYILININEQKNTQFPGTQSSDVPTVIQNMRGQQSRRGITNIAGSFQAGLQASVQLGQQVSSSVTNAVAQSGLSGPLGVVGSTFDTGKTQFKELADKQGINLDAELDKAKDQLYGVKGDSFLRTIRRTTDTIALYMPDTLKFSYGQKYTPLELGGKVTSLAGGAAFASGLYDSIKGGTTSNMSTFAVQGLAELAPVGSTLFKALATAATGVAKNPMLEVIYQQPDLRQFSFSFMFYPRSEKEAEQVQKILDRLRFHQAPEIKKNTGGFFLIPPSEFDISFMYNGRPNPNIDRVSTCVLTNIAVDYAPKGFHAYEVGGENDPKLGRTGMPVGIGVTLSFMETQIITKEYYRDSTFEKIDMQNPGGSAAMGSAMNSAQDGPGNNPTP